MPDWLTRSLAIALSVFVSVAPLDAGESLTFEKDVRPIFKAYCLDCHGGGEAVKGHLDLRLKRFVQRGGDSGPAIVAGRPEESLLIERLKNGEMPPGEKKVPQEQVVLIERWIASGAVVKRTEPEHLDPGIDLTPEERAYWAFQPVRRPEPPSFGPNDRVRTQIDAFVLAKLAPARSVVRSRRRQANTDPTRGLRPHRAASCEGGDRHVPRGLGRGRL